MTEQFVALRHRHGTISDLVGGRTKVSTAAAPNQMNDHNVMIFLPVIQQCTTQVSAEYSYAQDLFYSITLTHTFPASLVLSSATSHVPLPCYIR